MNKKKEKKCAICEKSKPKTEFSMSSRHLHRLEYCKECEEKKESHIFLHNAAQFAIDAVSKEYADMLLLKEIVIYKKDRYHIVDEHDYRKSIKFSYPTFDTSGFVVAIGKYGEKRKQMSLEKAEQLVAEEACTWEGEHLRFLFSGKELERFVLERDEHVCYYCHEEADRIAFLTPRSQEGLLSPKNTVAVCRPCKDEKGENLYFFKWLNVPILEKEEKEKEENVYTMWDFAKQTQFWIREEHARTLIDEGMAEVIDERSIHILFNRKDFWEYVRNRDERICYYCEKYGDTVDHIKPRSKGGLSTPDNCVCACSKCNEKKSNLEKDVFLKSQGS